MTKTIELSQNAKDRLSGGLVKLQRDPDQETQVQSLDRTLIIRILRLMEPYYIKRNWLLFCVLLRSIEQPAFVWAVAATINGPISHHAPISVTALAGLGVLALAAFMQVTLHFRQRLTLELGEAVVNDLRRSVFEHLQKMPMAYFHRTKVGRVISRIGGDCDAVRIGVQDVLFVSMIGLGQMIFTAAFMIALEPSLFLIVLAMAPIVWVLSRLFQNRLKQAYREIQESFSRVTSTLAESVAGIRVTQGFDRSQRNAELFSELVVDHADYNMKAATAWSQFIPLLEFNTSAVTAAVIAVGGWRVLQPETTATIADLIQFLFLTNLFFVPIQILGDQYNQALAAMAGAERVFGLLDRKPDWEDVPNAIDLPAIVGRLEVDRVSFEYVEGRPVLNDIDFVIEPGKSVAIVGPTGSGKSTMLGLIARFYLPTKGQVRIDGYDTRVVSSLSIASQIAIVLQNNFLFSGTIRENLQIASKGEINDEQIYHALEAMECDDIVDNLPHKLDTVIGGRGANLSLGQRQLICFARALLADPRILILDEATSSVDALTEARVQRSISRLLSNRTCFIVAHRLSTIRTVDQILVMDHGKIIQRGTHTVLASQPGLYADLLNAFETK